MLSLSQPCLITCYSYIVSPVMLLGISFTWRNNVKLSFIVTPRYFIYGAYLRGQSSTLTVDNLFALIFFLETLSFILSGPSKHKCTSLSRFCPSGNLLSTYICCRHNNQSLHDAGSPCAVECARKVHKDRYLHICY